MALPFSSFVTYVAFVASWLGWFLSCYTSQWGAFTFALVLNAVALYTGVLNGGSAYERYGREGSLPVNCK